MTEQIEIQEYYGHPFELTIQIRDSKGNPTGRTKTVYGDKASAIAYFWHRNKTPVHNKKSGGNLPDAKQAEKILKDTYGDK